MLRMGGKPTSYIHEIKIKKTGEEVRIIPFSDVHWGAKNCASEKFIEHLKRAGDHPHAWFIGGGDYLDFSKAGDRAIIRNCAESTTNFMDEIAQQKLEEFYSVVAPIIKGRTIGLLEGNHHWQFSVTGDTCTERLCQMLGVKYLGCLSSIVLKFEYSNCRASYPIFIAHRTGAGGGYTAGASFNQLQRAAGWFRNAKAYISGDDHSLGHITIGGMIVDRNTGEWKDESIHLIKTGQWQKAYMEDVPNYLVEKPAAPKALGLPYITLRYTRTQLDKKQYVKLHSSVTA
jgi:hypothetical protein